MKTKVLALAVLFSLVSINVTANTSKPDDVNIGMKVLSSKNLAKERIVKQDEASDMKVIYTSDSLGNRTAKIVYGLDKESGNWIVSHRTEYKYNKENKLTQIINVYWDKANAKWTNIQVQNVLPC